MGHTMPRCAVAAPPHASPNGGIIAGLGMPSEKFIRFCGRALLSTRLPAIPRWVMGT